MPANAASVYPDIRGPALISDASSRWAFLALRMSFDSALLPISTSTAFSIVLLAFTSSV